MKLYRVYTMPLAKSIECNLLYVWGEFCFPKKMPRTKKVLPSLFRRRGLCVSTPSGYHPPLRLSTSGVHDSKLFHIRSSLGTEKEDLKTVLCPRVHFGVCIWPANKGTLTCRIQAPGWLLGRVFKKLYFGATVSGRAMEICQIHLD